jgi:hypothetical protein
MMRRNLMPDLPPLHLKLANQIILYFNASGLMHTEKLSILQHVHRQIISNLTPEERAEYLPPPQRRRTA